jgi:phage terminase large subunit
VEIHLRLRLQPKQKKFRQSLVTHPVTLYGGAKGGGKSKGLRDIFLERRFRYPGSVGYIFRETFPELVKNHIDPLLEEYPWLRPFYHSGKRLLRLPNGSVLGFGYVEHKKDLKKYQGAEFHDLGIEEAGNWPEEYISTLWGSNRSSKAGIPARLALTANPGGLAHQYLKRLFVRRELKSHELAAGFKPSDFNYIQALVTDNAALMKADPDYAKRLEANPNEMLRRAYRYGDWDIAAGQFFSEFNRDVHVVKPFKIPAHWPRFWSYDYGFGHPAAWLLWACDGDGNVYVVREIVEAGLYVHQQAAKVKDAWAKLGNSEPIIAFAGLDCWASRTQATGKGDDASPTIAEAFASHEIYLKHANVARTLGWTRCREYLHHFEEEVVERDKKISRRVGPKCFFFETCPIIIEGVARAANDPDNPEDVLKVDADHGDPYTGDDAIDSWRYGIMSRPAVAFEAKPEKRDRYSPKAKGRRGSWQTA